MSTTPSPPGTGVGSVKLGKPCCRMHGALTAIWCTCSPVIRGGVEPPGRKLAHAFWAETNAASTIDRRLFGPLLALVPCMTWNCWGSDAAHFYRTTGNRDVTLLHRCYHG